MHVPSIPFAESRWKHWGALNIGGVGVLKLVDSNISRSRRVTSMTPQSMWCARSQGRRGLTWLSPSRFRLERSLLQSLSSLVFCYAEEIRAIARKHSLVHLQTPASDLFPPAFLLSHLYTGIWLTTMSMAILFFFFEMAWLCISIEFFLLPLNNVSLSPELSPPFPVFCPNRQQQ